LKLPAGPDARDEVRVPLGRYRKPPAQLVALSRAAHRGGPLQPVVELATVRREWTLVDAGGRAVATVTDDRVTGRVLDAEADGRTEPDAQQWAEIEVELAEHGTPDVLDRIEAVLAGAGVHRSASSSKLARVLADRVPAAPVRPVAGPGVSAGEVVVAYLAEQADALHATDPQVRQHVGEGVHQMRVACRRMRSTLQSFRPLLDRTRTDELVGELRWLAGELGGARDLEVQEERIGAAVAALPPEIVLGPVAAQTTRFFAGRRTTAARQTTSALDGDRYVALLDAVDALIADPPLTTAAADRAPAALRKLIAKGVRRVGKAQRAAHAHPAGHERDEHLHEMRKAAKRLRYAAEVATPALGRPAQKLVKDVKAMQELLGEHQDSVVARGLLRELGEAATTDGGNGFAFGWLLREEQVRAERVEDDLDAAWAALERRAAELAA
ncbi:MAG TPA: CYTH and CHAD domain-containing protein, partial [Pseudonocardia sp.]|nr:CYTH and CHAD domain-containing protein [Pseudonocardia sp.]